MNLIETEYVRELALKFEDLQHCPFLTFNEVKAKKNIMGVYMIYSPIGELLYIGSTNKFNIRFGVDLNHETTHTVMRCLLRDKIYTERNLAKEFLINHCKYRIHYCETKREAEALEHFAIWALNPKYNKIL